MKNFRNIWEIEKHKEMKQLQYDYAELMKEQVYMLDRD
jgi:hypothetical protein